MIKIVRVKENPHLIDWPEMPLAHEHCHGVGIELGAAANNRFNLPGSKNVCPWDENDANFDHHDYLLNKNYQIETCGAYAEVDIKGEADSIPVPDASQDYIISSHVIEHVPDVISAFVEWNRILKPDGTIFMIFPKRDSAQLDIGRPLTTLDEFIDCYQTKANFLTRPLAKGHGRRGHYNVFSLQSMLDLIAWCNDNLDLKWEIVATEESDSKVGNGHTVVARRVAKVANARGSKWWSDLGNRLFRRAATPVGSAVKAKAG